MKKLLFSLLIFMSCFAAVAQEQADINTEENDSLANRPAHYLVFDLGGGLHFLTYDMDDFGSKKPGYGFMGRAGYRFFFNRHWGIGTELNVKTFSTFATLDNVQEIAGAIDEEGDSYLHRTYFNGLKEHQKQFAMNIPLGVYYQAQLSKKWKGQLGLGAFYQLNEFSNKFETTEGDLETRGFYKEYNVELYGMDQHNFYTADGFEGDNTKKSCFGVFAEGNLLYQVTPRLEIDLGVYFAYGLNYQKESQGNLVYNPDCMEANAYKNPVYHGVLESNIVDKSSPLATGLMAGIRYKLGKSADKKKLDDGDDDPNKQTNVADSTDNKQNVDIDDNGDNGDNNEVVVDNGDGNNGDAGDGKDGDDKTGNDNDDNGKNNIDRRTPGEILVDELKKFNKVAINFAFNDAHINPTPIQAEMFDAVAKFMKEYPDIELHIVGHTCNIGTLQQNKIVGQRRAEACKQEMLKRGVPANRITTESKAYLEPLVPNTSEENRKKNRRIEFSITDGTVNIK